MTVQPKPNILFIMTDQEQEMVTRPDHPCQTPNVNRLQKEGVTFTNAFTPMAHCCPARATMMTGMYPSKHGIFNNVQNAPAIRRSLNPGCELWSNKLKAVGYKLAYTGKWHVAADLDPCRCGWEEVEPVTAKGSCGRNDFDGYFKMPKEDKEPRKRGEILQPGWGRRFIYKVAEGFTYEQTNNYKIMKAGIDKLPQLAAKSEPWCLFISMPGPHGPFNVPEKYAKMYDPKAIDLPPNYHDEMTNKPRLYQRMRKKYSQLTEGEVKESIAHYWGYCSMMDDLTGEILDALDKTGQTNNTMVIFLSDHGDFCGAHGLYAKGIAPFDEAYKIPLVVRWPKAVKQPGRTVDAFITLADISPTVTEAAGAEPTADPSGKSLVPFLQGKSSSDWPDAFYNQCNGVEIYYTQRMVRTHKWKLVYNPVDMDELYNLENDPYEVNNLIDKPELQPVVKALFGKIWLKGAAERDYMSSYHTTNHAPYGPAFVLGTD